MKTKRVICIILSIMMALSALASCQAEALVSTDPPESSTPTQTQDRLLTAEEQINGMDIPDLWKQELLHAAELGMPMDKVRQETISGAEMAELLDHFVEYADPDKLAEWKALLPKLRTHEDALTRFDAMGALFLAAQTVGGDWAEFKVDFNIVFDPLQFPYDNYYFTSGLFGEYDTPRYTVPGWGDSNYLDGACPST